MAVIHPYRYVARIDYIDLDELYSQGIRCILFDRDNTVVPRDSKVAPPEIMAWFDRARDLGMYICMVSNNIHSAAVEASATKLKSDVIHHAMKPFPCSIKAALRRGGVEAQQSVMIGDQVMTDVIAGNLAGVRTILVRPQCRTDLWYTHIFRLFEALILRGKEFEGEAEEL